MHTRNAVGYCVGLAKNAWLNALTEAHRDCPGAQFAATHLKQREFTEFRYTAHTKYLRILGFPGIANRIIKPA